MKIYILIQFCLVILLVIPANSQSSEAGNQTSVPVGESKSFGLFEDDNLLEITLRFDLSTYFRTKPKKDYLNARITFFHSKEDSVSRNVRLKTRGIFRNQYCTFAPIDLSFKKADFGYTDLNKISKIKLSTQCKSDNENANYILREYLVYKLFNVLTDTSFRVRLVKVKYIDSEKKRKPIIHFGFFVEPLDMLTSRTNTIQIISHSLTQKSIIPDIMDRLAIFNYMIGNYDWSVPLQHNVKVVKSLTADTTQLGIAIPFDFDWTGLVNPPWAIPTEEMGIRTVRERIFNGICRNKQVYQEDLGKFIVKKDEFYRVINDFPYLKEKEKKDITDYLDEFFDQLTRKSGIIEYMLNSCKNILPLNY